MSLSLETLHSGSTKSRKLNWPPKWTGETAVCLANGPSLTKEQVSVVQHARKYRAQAINAIVINDVFRIMPDADILYAADARWWNFHKPQFDGIKLCGEALKLEDQDDVVLIEVWQTNREMAREPGYALSGSHSGFQALNIALTLGVNRVLLLGYDCRKLGGKRNSIEHEPQFQIGSTYDFWQQQYHRVTKEWPDVEVINCSLDSAITAFPKYDVAEVLS